MTAGTLILLTILLAALAAPWAARGLVRDRERPDGAPSTALLRCTGCVNIAFGALLLALGLVYPGRVVMLAHLWRHDVWSALLFGALAGLFLHVVGGGSPLPVAALGSERRRPVAFRGTAGLTTVTLFALGEAALLTIWFGAGLPSLLHPLTRLLSLALIAAAYGSGRAAAGQDHPLTGAIDGLLLGLLYLLTGSFVAVVVAHFLVDILAYASAAGTAEDAELAQEAGQPILSRRDDGRGV